MHPLERAGVFKKHRFSNYEAHQKNNPEPQPHTVPLYRGNNAWSDSYRGHTYILHKLSYFSSLLNGRNQERTKIYEKCDGAELGPYQGCKGAVVKLAYTPEDEFGVYSLRFSQTQRYLAVGMGCGQVYVINIFQCSRHTIGPFSTNGRPITSIRFHPSDPNQMFFSSLSGVVEHAKIILEDGSSEDGLSEERLSEEEWIVNEIKFENPLFHDGPLEIIQAEDLPPEEFWAEFKKAENVLKCRPSYFKSVTRTCKEKNNEINAMDLSITGETMATGGKDATVRIYDLSTQKAKVVMEYPPFNENCNKIKRETCKENAEEAEDGHFMRIMAVLAHPDNKEIFLTGGWDCTVKIWDLRAGKVPVRTCYGPFLCGDALDVLGNKILTAKNAAKRSIELWDFGSGRNITTVDPTNRPKTVEGEFFYTAKFYQGFCYPEAVSFMKDDIVIAGGSGLGVVEVISISENKVLKAFPAEKPVSCIDTLGTKIAFGASSGNYCIAGFIPFMLRAVLEPEVIEEVPEVDEEALRAAELEREMEEKKRAEEQAAAQALEEEQEEEVAPPEEDDDYESPPEDD